MEIPLAEFLQSSGMFAGRIPGVMRRPFISDAGIGFVQTPMDAVRLHILIERPWKRTVEKQLYLGSVSIGYCIEYAMSPTLPDLLVGWIDATGRWHWAGPEHGQVANLHSGVPPRHPGIPSWPVWFTFADFDGQRTDFIRSRVCVVDIYDAYRDARRRAFWDAAKQEFIAATWAPSRLPWCLDVDESSVLFPDVKV